MTPTHVRVDFGFGIQFDRDQHGIDRETQARAFLHIRDSAARLFGAYTAAYVYGGWTNPQGKMVREDGITLFTMQVQDETLEPKIIEMASLIKTALNQEAVAITITPCQSYTL